MLKVHRLTVAFVGLVWLALPFAAFGVPALGKPRTVQQPNGNHLQVVQKGDEWSNHVENGRGYAISRGSDGVWRYVRGYDSKRKPLLDATLAHKSPPPGLQKHLSPPSSRPKGAPNAGIKGAGSALVGPTGSMSAPVLFILAEFSDTAGSTNESNWADFTNNKVPDYFSATSHGNAILSPANETFGTADDGVVGWVNVGVAHPDTYGTVDNRNRNLAADAIIAADPFIDFSTYDLDSDGFVDGDELAIVVIVAGYETAYGGTDFSIHPAVWGHQWGWSTNRPAVDGVEINSYAQFGERHGWDVYGNVEDHQATMGIMVHELGHLVFDLPDLYDTDGSSAGIGSFGLMGSGSWGWTEADLYNNDFEGTTPVNACAWTKVQLQWAAAPEGDETETIIASGISDPDSLPGGVVFRASTYGAATEYFLVENRQNVGYDAGLEGLLSSAWFVDFGGLAIWHIDDTQTDNTNDSNRWVDLEEADGTDMENVDYGRGHPTALWYAGNAAVFDDTTNPSSDLNDGSPSGVDIYNISASDDPMTADFGSVSPPPPASTMHVGDLDSEGTSAPRGKWDATVTIAVVDESGSPLSNATVVGQWSDGANGSSSCTTDLVSGNCNVSKNSLKNNVNDVTFTVTNVTHTSYAYNSSENTDPDGDSDGTSTLVSKPGSEPPPFPPPNLTVHIGDLDGSSTAAKGTKWNATVTITLRDEAEGLVSGVTINGSWSDGVTGTDSCTTGVDGICSIDKNNIKSNAGPSVHFDVTGVTGADYDSLANDDPDGDSDGTSIEISQP